MTSPAPPLFQQFFNVGDQPLLGFPGETAKASELAKLIFRPDVERKTSKCEENTPMCCQTMNQPMQPDADDQFCIAFTTHSQILRPLAESEH